jgi:transketolase
MSLSTASHPVSTFDDLDRLVAMQTGDEKHGAAAESTLDVLWVLYDQILNIGPSTVASPDRDRFLLSKGHGPMAYYAVLAAKGFFPVDWLPGLAEFDSPLGHHPDRNLVPGVEISSGSLGHGLPLAIGVALGLRAQGVGSRVVCLVGDAELEEGSNAEAIVYAGAAGLSNLTVVAVDNHSSSIGWSGGVETRFDVEAWVTQRVDGRDHEALRRALSHVDRSRPTLVVADVEVNS